MMARLHATLKSSQTNLIITKAWFDNKSIGNIYSFAKLMDKYRITDDPKKYFALYTHVPKIVPVKFKLSPEGLYHIDINTLNNYKKKIRETNNVLSTVHKNMEGFALIHI